jgi:acylphosphatase
MPKVAPDLSLQKQVQLYIQEQEISVRKVAELWGVSNSSLSRFCKTGKALEVQRRQYRRALERDAGQKRGTNGAAVTEDNGEVQPLVIGDSELRRIRQACESVLKLLDAYERNFDGAKSTGHH